MKKVGEFRRFPNKMENDNPEQQDEVKVFESSFQRITEGVVQNGFADGVADGRETLYQQDFDRGYKEGFAMAFTLGCHKGYATGTQQHGTTVCTDLILKQEASRAHCQLCTDKTLEERMSLDKIIAVQQKHNAGVKEKLAERYGLSS
ncbi:uncharacterized protein LOC120419895 [Culex pipiens pallens]|uniref:uncharacterized protein LOC120419895 n=1 Tax=Culex pipiens pallens TaxID=42434 RepID=UPI001952E8F3|nr:uncharacterized protein LOC120419895 [Culex pipiens pallens]